jgi:dTDP-4-dehydrorhamnose 3,5-epimerase
MSTRFDILDTPFSGLRVLQRKPIGDSRGYLERLFCSEELQTLAPGKPIAQINHTLTASRGTLRGMHFQRPPHAETKFVSCLRGEVFDVAVDLRHNSPTFLRWHAEVLSADNHKTLVIPEGFAHGFQTLADDCEMLYFHTAAYQNSAEGGLNAQDPQLAIAWPLPVAGLSPRDATHPFLGKDFTGVA